MIFDTSSTHSCLEEVGSPDGTVVRPRLEQSHSDPEQHVWPNPHCMVPKTRMNPTVLKICRKLVFGAAHMVVPEGTARFALISRHQKPALN